MKLLSAEELKTVKGIPYSGVHLWRLTKAGEFPQPVKLGARCNAWIEQEIDEWVEAKAAEREAA